MEDNADGSEDTLIDRLAQLSTDTQLLIETQDAMTLHNVLKGVVHKDTGYIVATNIGLKLIVHELGTLHATVYLKADAFSRFELKESPIQFKLPVSLLSECLGLFGSFNQTGLGLTITMTYNGYGTPLIMRALGSDDDVKTMFEIATQHLDDTDTFNAPDFDGANMAAKVIVMGDLITDVVNELALAPLTKDVTLAVEHEQIVITFGGREQTAVTWECPKSADCIHKYSCNVECKHTYRAASLRRVHKSSQTADRASLRIDRHGTLSMQFMFEMPSTKLSFVEYFISANVEEDDDE